MRFQQNFLVLSVLALAAIGLASVALTAYTTQSAEYERQMEFVKKFYGEYRALPGGARRPPVDAYFSRELARLLAVRRHMCERSPRNDLGCDDGIDDTLGPAAAPGAGGFSFDQAGLREIHSGYNTVDVLDRPSAAANDSMPVGLRYLLVKQEGGWRIDNILYSRWGVFSADGNLRQEVQQDIQDQTWLTSKSDRSTAALPKARHEHP